MGTRPLLELENLSTHYVSARGTRVVRAVDEVSLSIHAGETLGIVGESGSGKSTLALTILRLLPPAARIASGRMLFEGEDLLQKSDARDAPCARQAHRHDPAGPHGVAEPAFHDRGPGGRADPGTRGSQSRHCLERAFDLLKSVRIPSPQTRLSQHPHEMSGGMRQRIVGAIGISCGPRLLIADEPTTSLDLTIQAQYLNLLRELQRAHGLALIFITHNLGIVAKMCDRLAVMYAGRVVESGPVRADIQLPRASLHPGPAQLDPAHARQSRAAHRDRRPAARPDPLPPGCAFAPRCPTPSIAAARRRRPQFTFGDGATRALLACSPADDAARKAGCGQRAA